MTEGLRIHFQVHSVVVGRTPFLVSCWAEDLSFLLAGGQMSPSTACYIQLFTLAAWLKVSKPRSQEDDGRPARAGV